MDDGNDGIDYQKEDIGQDAMRSEQAKPISGDGKGSAQGDNEAQRSNLLAIATTTQRRVGSCLLVSKSTPHFLKSLETSSGRHNHERS